MMVGGTAAMQKQGRRNNVEFSKEEIEMLKSLIRLASAAGIDVPSMTSAFDKLTAAEVGE